MAVQSPSPVRPTSTGCRSLAVTSGKGGVGKSVLALNLAVALQQLGQRVCLLDASFALGHLELLCGLNSYWNLTHVLSGARHLDDVLLDGPGGIHLIAGLGGLVDGSQQAAWLWSTLETLEARYDWLIVDTGGGGSRLVRPLVTAADDALVVTTPEATALADAYAAVKSLAGANGPELGVIVNQAASAEQASKILDRLAATARHFLHVQIGVGTWVPSDPAVPQSVHRRQPFVVNDPQGDASRSVRRLAARLAGRAAGLPASPTYFRRLAMRTGTSHADL
jgi:flagellar biosynthesis protein FlhG